MGKLYITGSVQFDVEPDTATLAILVEGRDYDYAACAAAINQRTQVAHRVLEEGGVGTDLIRSYDYRVEKMNGWELKHHPGTRFSGKHDLRVTLPLDRDQLNRLLGGLMLADAALEISLGYEVRDLSAHRDKAEALAVGDALRRARISAEAAGCRVIRVRTIHAGMVRRELHSANGYDYTSYESESAMSMCVEDSRSPQPKVAPRMLGVSASVDVCVDIAAQTTQ